MYAIRSYYASFILYLRSTMVAVITGDIINSREGDVKHWITNLKRILALYGTESMDWEIFRGDSFQLKLSPELALKAAFHIKASSYNFV